MREMKDSGIEWIGEIPKHWKCCKQKYGLTLLNGRAFKESEFLEDGKYKVLRVGNLFTNPIWHYSNLMLEDNKYCQKGDLLYSWSMSYAPFIWSGDKVIYHYHIWKVLIDDILCKKFVYYYLLALTEALYAEIHETTMGFITMGIMNNSYLPYCNLEEQQQIANFLDTQCSKIDATAEDIQKEISLLEDYKKSVITEAVTKGLNPDAEMKDSGIEWIGEIPKDWKVDKIKYHLKRNEPKNPGNAIVLSVYRDYGVIPKDSRDDNHNVTSEDTSKYKFVKKGQLVINKMKAWQGSLAVSDYDGIVSPAYFIYDFIDEEYNHKYFHYLVRSCYKEEFKRISGGIREGQWDLSPEEFSNTLVLLPSVEEQNEILDYILQKEMEIDTLITDKKRQLDILADYKKSLIYEYVTGKKEVPVNE